MLPRKIDRSELKDGDHISVRRYGALYAHHGIYTGGGRVVHYTDSAGFAKKKGSRIVETSLDDFLRDGELRYVDHPRRCEAALTLRRTQRWIDKGGYHVLFNNCEHFATYCATGKKGSKQVKRFAVASATAAVLVAWNVFALRRKFLFF